MKRFKCSCGRRVNFSRAVPRDAKRQFCLGVLVAKVSKDLCIEMPNLFFFSKLIVHTKTKFQHIV